MLPLQGLLVLLLAASHAAAYPCTPADLKSCPQPPGALASVSQVPQFITITWDDGVNPQSYDIIQQITGGFKQRNGCPLPSTYFVCVANTIPAAVQALYLTGNEIATHTVTHVGYPSVEEIVGARDWLVNNTGIPESKLTGFRAPFLLANSDTRQTLEDAGFQYDSSIPDSTPSNISPDVTKRGWPYSMSEGIPQDCNVGICNSTEKYDLWEIPLWSVEDASKNSIASMDPDGNAFDNYKRELAWRMTGNHAPLGLFLHAGLQSQPDRIAELRQFIGYAMGLDNVWFVTNQQLLAWMQNPVPASRVETMLKCDKPTDISPDMGPVCDTYVGNCEFGSFDSTQCRCVCLGEGTPGGYCVDPATGSCTKTC